MVLTRQRAKLLQNIFCGTGKIHLTWWTALSFSWVAKMAEIGEPVSWADLAVFHPTATGVNFHGKDTPITGHFSLTFGKVRQCVQLLGEICKSSSGVWTSSCATKELYKPTAGWNWYQLSSHFRIIYIIQQFQSCLSKYDFELIWVQE